MARSTTAPPERQAEREFLQGAPAGMAPPELDPAQELVGLIPVLAAAYGVVLATVALVTGWQLLSDRKPSSRRRGAVAPPVGAIERADEGVR